MPVGVHHCCLTEKCSLVCSSLFPGTTSQCPKAAMQKKNVYSLTTHLVQIHFLLLILQIAFKKVISSYIVVCLS